jgi:alkaline phosphatase D
MKLAQKQLTTRFQAISDARDRQATVHTLKEFVVEDGRPGAQA